MAKVMTTLFMVVLLLCFTLSRAGRPKPAFSEDSSANNRQLGVEGGQHVEVVDELCEGLGDEECLMRRTLAAHIDYIYTQKQKP